jgi:hypothetical protein
MSEDFVESASPTPRGALYRAGVTLLGGERIYGTDFRRNVEGLSVSTVTSEILAHSGGVATL